MKAVKLALAGGVALFGATMLSSQAQAQGVPTPTCTIGDPNSTANITVTGGTAALVGQTVCQEDKVYTNFVFSASLAAAVSTSQFNLFDGTPTEIHELVLLGAFNAGDVYTFSYDFYVNPATPDFDVRNIVQSSLSYTSPLQTTAAFSKDIRDGFTSALIDTIATNTGARDDSVFYSTKWIKVSATLNIPGGTGGVSTLNDSHTQSIVPVPEPMALSIMGAGLAGLGFAARRRRGS